ncbi:MAG: hypothetical protein ACOH1N_10325 [Lutibacter sp.]
MINKALKYIKYGSIYGAVEHQKCDEGERLALLLLKKKKNEFNIELQNQFSSIVEMVKIINKEQHLYLIVNNNQVLSKSITKDLNENNAIQKAFPNIKINDFYYEILQLDEKTYISICRKEYVNELINTYKKQHLNIIGFALGNSLINNLIPFVEKDKFSTSNAIITTNKNELVSIDLVNDINETPYKINGIEISNSYILSLAGIITYYTNNSAIINNFGNYNSSILKEFIQKRVFSIGLKSGLGLLFISLLINFLVFDYYNNHIENLTQKTQINQSQKEQLLFLNSELNNKKKLVDDIVNSSSSKTSLYFDQIGSSLPSNILLNSIEYQPVLKNIEPSKEIDLNRQKLFIKGSAAGGESFSNWIEILEKLEWIKSVDIMDYGTGKKTSTSFELRIELK